MSHLGCPMCGLSVPLSYFEYAEIELDLTLKEFRGLGRGKGFESLPPTSVLGDDEYSPKIYNKVADLCRMFIKAGLPTPDGCTYAKILVAERAERISLPQTMRQSIPTGGTSYQTRHLEEEIEKLKETIKLNIQVERILGRLMQNSDFNIIPNEGVPLIIEITEVHLGFFEYMLEILTTISEPIRAELRKRLKAENVKVHFILEKLLFETPPRKKSLAERMLEWEPGL